MKTISGLFERDECHFYDHGANRLGASELMQGLADGYFVLHYTIGEYLSGEILSGKVDTNGEAFVAAEEAVKSRLSFFTNNKGNKSVDYFHKQLGKVMWDDCGMARSKESLTRAATEIAKIKEAF